MKTFLVADLYEKLHFHFDYNPLLGELTWKVPRVSWIKVGDVVGSPHNAGYKQTKFYGQHYLVHRLIWLYHYKELPELIDHIDRNRANNRIENLRVSDKHKNAHNSECSIGSVPYRGVSIDRKRNKYAVHLKINGKRYFGGYFNSSEDAYNKYIRMKERLL